MRLMSLLIVAAVTSAGCGGAAWVGPPRFGALTQTAHPLAFAPEVHTQTLPNGLRAAIVPDARTNLVTIDVRYQVGAGDDPAGRAGLAHLVEHLSFETRERAGGPTLGDELGEVTLDANAWTTSDEVHFYATAAAAQLDRVLALEARRLRAGCAQLDDASFARERDVVVSETAWRSDLLDPARSALRGAIYGDHRYGRDGDDVAAIGRADVCGFMAAHLTPAQAIVVVGGAVDPAQVEAAITRHFAGGAAAAPAPLPAVPPPALAGTSRHQAPIERPVAIVALPHPAWGAPGRHAADLAVAILEAALADVAADDAHRWLLDVDVAVIGGPRAPVATVTLVLDDAARFDDAVALVFATAADALRDSDARQQRLVARLRGAAELAVVADWDEVTDRGGRIADYLQYTSHTYFMLRDLTELASTSAGELRGVLRGYERARAHAALIAPDGGAANRAPLTAAPQPGVHAERRWHPPIDLAEADRPLASHARSLADVVERRTLANGLEVELAPDPASPIVDARIVFAGGYLDEPPGRPGVARLAADLLDHDYAHPYATRDYEPIVFGLERGTQLRAMVGERSTVFSARGLANEPGWHLWRLAWLIDKGGYSADDLTAWRKQVRRAQQISGRDADAVDPDQARARRRYARVFGADHPYAHVEASAEAWLRRSRGELAAWRQAHYRVRGARLVVSGGFDPAAAWPDIEALFGAIVDVAPAPPGAVARPTPRDAPSWLAEDDPTRAQTRVVLAHPAASDAVADAAARAVLVAMLDDRLQVVRATMGVSYGVSAGYVGGAGGSALEIAGDVAPAATAAAVQAMLGALDGLVARDPAFVADFVRARRRALAAADAYTGGARSVAWTLAALAAAGLSLDQPRALAAAIAAVTPAQVAAVAAQDLAATRRVVQLTGPPPMIAAAFAALGVTPERAP